MNVNKENIEAYLLDYAEGMLTPQQKEEVESFLALNPQYKEMLALYDDSIKLEEEPVIFMGKEDLKRGAVLPWKKIAYTISSLAAVALLLLGLFKFDFNNKTIETNPVIVNPIIAKTSVADSSKKVDEPLVSTRETSTSILNQETTPTTPEPKQNAISSQQEEVEPIHHTPEIERNLLAENTSTQDMYTPQQMDTIIIIRSATERPESRVDKMERYIGERTVNNLARTVGFVQNVARGAKEIKKSFKF